MLVSRASRALTSQISASFFSWRRIEGPLFVLQGGFQRVEQSFGGFFARQSAQFVERLALEIELLGQFVVAAVGLFDFFGQLALVAFDHPLLSAESFGLLVEGVLAFVEHPFAFVQFLPQLGLFAFALGLLLDGAFFDAQFGLFDVIGAIALGPGDDFAGFAFGVSTAEAVEQLDQDDGQNGSAGGDNEIGKQLRKGHGDTSRNARSRVRPAAQPIHRPRARRAVAAASVGLQRSKMTAGEKRFRAQSIRRLGPGPILAVAKHRSWAIARVSGHRWTGTRQGCRRAGKWHAAGSVSSRCDAADARRSRAAALRRTAHRAEPALAPSNASAQQSQQLAPSCRLDRRPSSLTQRSPAKPAEQPPIARRRGAGSG